MKAFPGLAFGGDYNPEQWPREVWLEDVRLMRAARVNLVSVGVFSWALLEPHEGEFDFGWMDDLLDLLHTNHIAVDLATPTAAPPAWFYATYPQARVHTAAGVPLGPGSRGAAAPSSPEYRDAAARIAGELAARYGDHPAVVLWHVHNEYGAPVFLDYSPAAEARFRLWLRERYGSLDRLNGAWGTAFWGQSYAQWSHVGVPGPTASVGNPAQQLDFRRFSDQQLRECFIAERDAIRAHARQPVTTNFMADNCSSTDLWAWAREVDIVSNDHYLVAADPEPHIGLAYAADLTRSLAEGQPWLLLEHSTSAVNWQPRNVAKRPGEMARNSLAHVARGSDSVLFFQWRASRQGAEKFHSAMLSHTGTRSRVWQEVVALGQAVASLAEVTASQVHAQVALLWDQESFWAQDLEWRPSEDLTAEHQMHAYYRRLWRDGVTVDFAHPGADLSGYRLVIAPASYLLSTDSAANLKEYVAQGGHLVVGCFSAVVDEFDAVHTGGFLAPLADVLGVRVDEHLPMPAGASAELDLLGRRVSAAVWQEFLLLEGAEVVGSFEAEAGAPALPAVTRNHAGHGTGWYVATCLDDAGLAVLLRRVYAEAGLDVTAPPDGVEIVVREGASARYTFAINHSDSAARLTGTPGRSLIGPAPLDGVLDLPPGAVAVVAANPKQLHTEPLLADARPDAANHS